jgi:hypothetical protein
MGLVYVAHEERGDGLSGRGLRAAVRWLSVEDEMSGEMLLAVASFVTQRRHWLRVRACLTSATRPRIHHHLPLYHASTMSREQNGENGDVHSETDFAQVSNSTILHLKQRF